MRGKAEATLVLEQAILDIVEERAPITVRGVCYALFVRKLIPSMAVGQTQHISRITTAMREDETLDWTKIVDGSRAVERARHGATRTPSSRPPCAAIVATTGRTSRPSSRCGSEKSTVEGVLAPVLDELGVAFRVMKGFGSLHRGQAGGRGLERRPRAEPEDRRPVRRRLGPGGLYMSEVDLPKRLARYGGQEQLKRIALLKEDTARLPHFEVGPRRATRAIAGSSSATGGVAGNSTPWTRTTCASGCARRSRATSTGPCGTAPSRSRRPKSSR